jgi:hypothetical protein
VENLLPGKVYSCFGKIDYPGFSKIYEQSVNSLEVKTNLINITPTPYVHEIKIFLDTYDKSWKMKIFYKPNIEQTFTMLEVEEMEMAINDLDMSTEYEIRISVDDDECESFDTKCHTITNIRTKIDIPYPPSAVKLQELENSTLQLTWSPPTKFSGTELKYNLIYSMDCLEHGWQKCPEYCAKIKDTSTKRDSTEATTYNFDGLPYMKIMASVAAVNSEGIGEYGNTTTDTRSKGKYFENITIISDAKETKIFIRPGCPYTGSFIYMIGLKRQNNVINTTYGLVNEETEEIPHSFTGLVPATTYNVCVMADQLVTKCEVTMTKLIPPENAPSLEFKKSGKDMIIKITKTTKIYAYENDTLKYKITSEMKCIQEVPECPRTNCSSILKTVNFTRSSILTSFQESLLQMNFNQQYRVRGSAINSVGEGVLGNWTEWVQSIEAENEDLQNLTINFSLTTTTTSITVKNDPICPFIGKEKKQICSELFLTHNNFQLPL